MLFLLLAAALQAPPAPAALARPAPPTAVSAVKVIAKVDDPYEKVCRHEQRTGSKITTPVCHTREEWALMEEGSRAFMDRALHPTGCASGSTC